MFKPRDYQEKSVEDLWQWFYRHPEGNPILNLCVGAGKSLIIAMIIQRALREYPRTRIIVIAHQKELIQQNLDKLINIWPEADVGIYSSALGKKELGRKITYATIGSIYKDAHLMGEQHLILADEAHLINTKESGMWRSFISDMRKYGNPGIRTIGLTGTPFRNGGVWITAGDDPLFHGIASTVSMRQLLDSGYLAPLVNASSSVKIDTSEVRTVAGDYIVSDLAKVSDKKELVESCCDEIVRLAAGRRRWLVFAVSVDHATHICESLLDRAVPCAVVTGETPKAERERLLFDYANDRLRCLVSIGVLTTGFDQPDIDFIALMRATQSPTLAVQMAGRGMRTAPGKVDCAFADFTDTLQRLGPIDLITGRMPKRKGSGERPVKLCESCGSINNASARECIDCGSPFEFSESDPHNSHISNAAVLSGEKVLTRYTVDRVTYAKHEKQGKNPSLRVEYWHGLRVVAKEWIAIESDSQYGRGRAVNWWSMREPKPMQFVPKTVDQAFEWIDSGFVLATPSAIIVNESGKYPEIISFEWGEKHEPIAA